MAYCGCKNLGEQTARFARFVFLLFRNYCGKEHRILALAVFVFGSDRVEFVCGKSISNKNISR